MKQAYLIPQIPLLQAYIDSSPFLTGNKVESLALSKGIVQINLGTAKPLYIRATDGEDFADTLKRQASYGTVADQKYYERVYLGFETLKVDEDAEQLTSFTL